MPEIQHELISRNVWVWWAGLVLPGVAFCRYYRAEIFHTVSLLCSSIWVDFFRMWSLWRVFTSCSLSSLNVRCGVSLAVDSQSKTSNSHLSNSPLAGLGCPGLPSFEAAWKDHWTVDHRQCWLSRPSGWRGVLRCVIFTRMASQCSACCWTTVPQQHGVPLQQRRNPPWEQRLKHR